MVVLFVPEHPTFNKTIQSSSETVDKEVADILPSPDEKDKLDVPDFEDEDTLLQPHPEFWLFMKISEESVDVYLHRRSGEYFEYSLLHVRRQQYVASRHLPTQK